MKKVLGIFSFIFISVIWLNAQNESTFFGSFDPHINGLDLPIADRGNIIFELKEHLLIRNGYVHPFTNKRVTNLLLIDKKTYEVVSQVEVIGPQGDMIMTAGTVLSDGKMVFTGEWLDSTTLLMHTFIAKYNLDLQLEWINLFPEFDSLQIKYFSFGICETSEGDFLIGLTQTDSSLPTYDQQSLGLIKTDANGELIFNKVFLDTFDAMLGYGNLTPTDDDHFIISAFSRRVINPSGHFVGLLHKIDTEGNIIWSQKELGDWFSTQVPLSTALPDGGAVMAYTRDSIVYFEDGSWISLFNALFAYDKLGMPLWCQNWIHTDNTANTRFMNLSLAKNGDVLGCGYWGRDGGKGTLGWLFRLNPETGEPRWERHYSDSLNWPTIKKDPFLFWRILELEDKRLAITGWKIDSTDHPDSADGLNSNILLMVLDSMGCLVPGCEGEDQVISSTEGWQVIQSTPLLALQVSPNPAKEHIFVQWPEGVPFSGRAYQLMAFDDLGRQIWSGPCHGNPQRIDTEKWPPGYVTLVCIQGGQPVASARILIATK